MLKKPTFDELSAYIDGVLSQEEVERVETYLNSPECDNEVHQDFQFLKELDEELKTMDWEEVVDPVPSYVLAYLREPYKEELPMDVRLGVEKEIRHETENYFLKLLKKVSLDIPIKTLQDMPMKRFGLQFFSDELAMRGRGTRSQGEKISDQEGSSDSQFIPDQDRVAYPNNDDIVETYFLEHKGLKEQERLRLTMHRGARDKDGSVKVHPRFGLYNKDLDSTSCADSIFSPDHYIGEPVVLLNHERGSVWTYYFDDRLRFKSHRIPYGTYTVIIAPEKEDLACSFIDIPVFPSK
ncbi:MAG: hypothetical protein B6244_13145 [Candidatus Cloacimonetes bacterium 4572_55]|nr:MAG: hypothetical protein B6244_13145 [Candidatus Cloacimonetes bacterium 4572_55]